MSVQVCVHIRGCVCECVCVHDGEWVLVCVCVKEREKKVTKNKLDFSCI